MKYKFFHKEISGIFTIPSGIISVEVPVIEKIAKEIPEIGILTTKSIGLEPKEGNKEPIIAEYAPFSFINAVGLSNPGVKEFVNKLSKIKIPDDKFLLISIFGDSVNEFRKIAEELYNWADGFELNISCPHSEKYGQVIGQDKKLMGEIIKNVVFLGKPVFVKISPNLNIKETIECIVKNGASGITAINTKGPELFLHNNFPVLSNRVGGISGKAILELGLKSVKEIRDITDLPVIACGGISTAEEVRSYKQVGADFFGVGSALAGMSTEEIKQYFHKLALDLKEGTNNAATLLKDELRMEYKEYKVIENKRIAEDLFLLKLDRGIKTETGQFIFTCLPGIGEKPFSVLDDDPLTLLVQKRGCFTNELSKLISGDNLFIRGPYGDTPAVKGRVLLVGGGTGVAALYLFAKRNKNVVAVLGAKDKNHLSYLEKFKLTCKELFLTTENGEIGYKGLVTDMLEEIIEKTQPEYCINCGPEPMVKEVIKKEIKHINPEKIYSSMDFLTKCGIGLCGSCASSKGYRSCVDGNFLKSEQI
ncbi:MAG: dihydroorotate dehydrogenase [Candidatus Nealsonbacteria bacterium]|nr:dihydroorotate dehydrogenase [Candidatus Nealsonbacteria bacterium]